MFPPPRKKESRDALNKADGRWEVGWGQEKKSQGDEIPIQNSVAIYLP